MERRNNLKDNTESAVLVAIVQLALMLIFIFSAVATAYGPQFDAGERTQPLVVAANFQDRD